MPDNALNLIAALYDNSYCNIQHNGQQGTPFHLSAGVRQGCPLSPLLYAAVAEVLLDNLEQHCPGTLVRAYADDTALVIEDLWSEGPVLATLFHQFAQISGLHLNIRKCNIIPLFPIDIPDFSLQLKQRIPSWQHMNATYNATYLGFQIGPKKSTTTWDAPLRKYTKRCNI